jgi:hypothetical protein
MLVTNRVYQWSFIAENATVGVNIYGYRDDTAVVYSATVFSSIP